MLEQNQFVPGQPVPARPPLAQYRPLQPMGVAADYVRALTAPGDLVVDLFCQGPRYVSEAVAGDRRALGLSINPLLLLAARLRLSDLDPRALGTAFSYLANGLKGDQPLQAHVMSLYRSACPKCAASGVAEWVAWDRDRGRPFEKGVRCPDCRSLEIGAADAEDLRLASAVTPRGLAYYYALDRAAPLHHPARERAAELVQCYTPRNLSALMDLTRRLEGLKADRDVKLAMMAVLVDCFDRASRLYPYDEERSRPRTLRIPVRYYERNVWLLFEEGFSGLKSAECLRLGGETGTADLLVREQRSGYSLLARPAKDIGDVLSGASAGLVLVDPPHPDGVFWALSALWATWLWNSPDSHAMRPFLRRRRFDWSWHWQALREALTSVGPCVARDGFLVTLFAPAGRTLLESVCLAASNADFGLCGWGYAPEVGYRLVWKWGATKEVARPSSGEFGEELVAEARAAVVETLHQRGEPTARSVLHAAACTALAKSGLLSSATAAKGEQSTVAYVEQAIDRGFDAAPITEVGEETGRDGASWWLAGDSCATGTQETLADRVEAVVRGLLSDRGTWTQANLINAVYARFPGALAPELTLVHVCIESYGMGDEGEIRLREEDDHHRRCREVDRIRHDLMKMGAGFGYNPVAGPGPDVRWFDEGRERYVFAISPSGALAHYLLSRRETSPGARRCLVVPGGRARLIGLKLQRDPRLAHAVAEDEWQFIKFRHLRRLVAKDDLDRYALGTVLGLDPVVEQDGAQLPLF